MIETRRGHRSSKRKLGEAGPRLRTVGDFSARLAWRRLWTAGAVVRACRFSEKLASVMSVYKVPQDETVQNELVRLQSETQLRAWPVVLQGTGTCRTISSLLPSQKQPVQALRQKRCSNSRSSRSMNGSKLPSSARTSKKPSDSTRPV